VLGSNFLTDPESFPCTFNGFTLFQVLQCNHQIVGSGNLVRFVFGFGHKGRDIVGFKTIQDNTKGRGTPICKTPFEELSFGQIGGGFFPATNIGSRGKSKDCAMNPFAK
jgi:hypothetical protein